MMKSPRKLSPSSSPSRVPHLVVHDGVDKHCHAVLGQDLLRRDLIGHRPHVNLLKDVDARDDKEDARTSSSSCEKPTKTEDHRSFVFLNNLDDNIEGEGEGGEDEEQGANGEEEGADA